MSAELQTQLEEKLARRKRIFNEIMTSPVATMEPEDISKLIRQTVEDVEALREKEAALRRVFADKIAEMKDDRLAQLRTYVPIPPTAYKDDDQERRTRPSKEKGDAFQGGAQVVQKPRARSVSAEDKNAANIAKALGMTKADGSPDIEAAKAWLESKKQAKPMIAAQPSTPLNTDDDSVSQEDMDKEAADNEVNLPE